MIKHALKLLVIFSILQITSCNGPDSKIPAKPLHIKYTLTAGKAVYTKNSWGKYWLVPVTLINNTDEVRSYKTWTCGWDEIYLVSSKTLERKYIPCQKNLPTVLGLGPHDSLKVFLPLKKVDKVNSKDIEYKIGFHVDFEFEDFIIWSNTVKMKL